MVSFPLERMSPPVMVKPADDKRPPPATERPDESNVLVAVPVRLILPDDMSPAELSQPVVVNPPLDVDVAVDVIVSFPLDRISPPVMVSPVADDKPPVVET